MPPERLAVSVIPVLTNARLEFERTSARVTADASGGEPGIRRSGVLVVVRTAGNVRRATEPHRRSSLGWTRCLTSTDVPMPAWSGLVWLERRGMHLLPGV